MPALLRRCHYAIINYYSFQGEVRSDNLLSYCLALVYNFFNMIAHFQTLIAYVISLNPLEFKSFVYFKVYAAHCGS